MHKKVRQLVMDGELTERLVTVGRGTYKYLYIAEPAAEGGSNGITLDVIHEKIDTMMRMFKELRQHILNGNPK